MTFREIAKTRSPVLTMHQATGGDLQLSARYRHHGLPMALAGELRAVFRTRQACWGTACLVRQEPGPLFTIAEVEFIAGLCEHIAHGLRTALLLEGPRSMTALSRRAWWFSARTTQSKR